MLPWGVRNTEKPYFSFGLTGLCFFLILDIAGTKAKNKKANFGATKNRPQRGFRIGRLMARSAAKKKKTVLFLEVRFAAVAKMHNGAQNMPGRISHHKRLQTEHSLKIKRQRDQAEDHTKGNADTNTPQQRQFQTTRFSKPFEGKELRRRKAAQFAVPIATVSVVSGLVGHQKVLRQSSDRIYKGENEKNANF